MANIKQLQKSLDDADDQITNLQLKIEYLVNERTELEEENEDLRNAVFQARDILHDVL